ncbi:uncharacterized protein LOC117294035 [Asterias rubens]|uniref:uncharacterized protein LOC117294035 n=1 Tax=Asterias rubens TaxID=7604 RepID=UPI001454F1A5|nr:uncharacterized protein LOC117294035 [Asterias rubens]
MTMESASYLFLLLFVSMQSPHPVEGGTTITRGISQEYGFMETARFEDCGVGGLGAFLNTSAYNRAECGIRCLMEDDCLSFEYDMENKTCSFFDYGALPFLRPKFGFVFADSVDPKVGEQHPCDDDPCLSGNICTEECYPNGFRCQCPDGLQGDTCNELSPVDGGFSRWGNWSECRTPVCKSISYRNCSNPWQILPGKDCVGPNTNVTDCDSEEECNVYPYVGCYVQSQLESNYDVSLVTTSSDMTIPSCMDICSMTGFKLAALIGNGCYCIRDMQATDLSDESQCSTNCPGDSSETCGGKSYASVYWAGSSSDGTSYRGCFSGSIQNGNEIRSYTPSVATPQVPTTTQSTSGDSNATTQAPPSTTPAYPGVTVRECLEECRDSGYQFTALFNASTCVCHNSLVGLTYETTSQCNMACPGGDEMGKYCGGSNTYSIFQMDSTNTEFWSEWFNFDSPWVDGNDIETTQEVANTMPWICANPLDIQCQSQDTPFDETGDQFHVECTLEGGINCTQSLQVYYVNVTFTVPDWRFVQIEEDYNVTELACEWVNASSNATSLNGTMLNQTMANQTMTNATVGNSTTGGVNGTMDNSTIGNTTVVDGNNGLDTGYLMCNNETLSLVRNITVNETYARLTWRMDKVAPQCNDYKFRLKCRNEPAKMIGCFSEGDVNDTITTSIGLDIGNCTTYCSNLGYQLVGMSKSAGECACGSSMKNNKVLAGQCVNTCGTEGYPCGGFGTQSVYYAGDCNLPFGITKSQMSGTPMHNNDATDDYDLWFDTLDQNPTIELTNFTNIDVDIPFEMEINLGSKRSFNRMETKGMYISGISQYTGVTKFRIGYKLDLDQDIQLVTERGLFEAKEFSVSSVTSTTSHSMGEVIYAQYVFIFVDDYDMFPGIKLDMYGCIDG